MKFLIPGGAGYIGSHMTKYLQALAHEVVVLDDFSTGHEWAVKDCEVLQVNLLDEEKLTKLLKGRQFDGVIHFAAKSLVGESVKKPDLYYRNNVVGTLNLVRQMLRNDINNLVFSSTAAIFGNPVTAKIDERHPTNPINPYGQSKLIVENVLQDMCTANRLNATCFRYFNAAGADMSGLIGETHEPETHLIPNVLKSTLDDGYTLKVYGDDYDTSDGTCIRDYVHVMDLAQAHMLGLDKMKLNKGFSAYNLGNSQGFSVLDVIKSCERITEKVIQFDVCERRAGDPASLVADSSRAVEILGWQPQHESLDTIIETAWRWHKSDYLARR
jgi:UDP-glucose 4-epimerase